MQFGLERPIGGGLEGSAGGSMGKSPWVPVVINGAVPTRGNEQRIKIGNIGERLDQEITGARRH